jgi:hypothetical protein
MLRNNLDKLPWVIVSVNEDKRTCVIAQAKPCEEIRVNIPFDQIRNFTRDEVVTHGHFKFPGIVHHEKIRSLEKQSVSGAGPSARMFGDAPVSRTAPLFGDAPSTGLALGSASRTAPLFGDAPSTGLALGSASRTAPLFGDPPSTGLALGSASRTAPLFGDAPGSLGFGQPPVIKSGFTFGQPPVINLKSGFTFGQHPVIQSPFTFGQPPAINSTSSFGNPPAPAGAAKADAEDVKPDKDDKKRARYLW